MKRSQRGFEEGRGLGEGRERRAHLRLSDPLSGNEEFLDDELLLLLVVSNVSEEELLDRVLSAD